MLFQTYPSLPRSKFDNDNDTIVVVVADDEDFVADDDEDFVADDD